MPTLRGQFDEHFIAEHDVTVQGTISAGATVERGAHLMVQGDFSGALHVEADASANIQGAFNGTIASNDGLVMLHGQIVDIFGPGAGQVVVGIDSIITSDDGAAVLQSDGTLQRLAPGTYGPNSFNIDVSRVCVYDEQAQRFIPLAPQR